MTNLGQNTLPPVEPAPSYQPAFDLALVTCYFNSNGFQTKRRNFEHFAKPIRAAGMRLLVIECAFGDADFELPKSAEVVQLRARDVLWQKERLLNLAIARLPRSCTKVAWLDADVLFEHPNWACDASRLLDRHPVVQLFDRAIRLPLGHAAYIGEGDAWPGFAAVAAKDPQAMTFGDFAQHGHTGFAWAARRDLLNKHGLYDACVAGSGDHMMAHAFCGDWSSRCIDRIIGANNRHRDYFVRWCERVYCDVRASVGFVPGTLLHLWHGELADRRYVHRNRELAEMGFNPAADLRAAPSGCWEWSSPDGRLATWAKAYFSQRFEDGRPNPFGEESIEQIHRSRTSSTARD